MERRRGPFHQVGRSNPPRCFVPRGWPPCLIYPRGCGTSVGLRQVSSASPGAAGITEGHTWYGHLRLRASQGAVAAKEPSPSPNSVLYHAGASHKSGQHSTTAPPPGLSKAETTRLRNSHYCRLSLFSICTRPGLGPRAAWGRAREGRVVAATLLQMAARGGGWPAERACGCRDKNGAGGVARRSKGCLPCGQPPRRATPNKGSETLPPGPPPRRRMTPL